MKKTNVKRVQLSAEEAAEILMAQNGTYPAHVHRRLLTLKLKAIDGMSSDEIAGIVGIHKTSVNRILARYKSEGMEAMVGETAQSWESLYEPGRRDGFSQSVSKPQ